MAYFPSAMAGGSPAVDELKNAYLIASGSSTATGQRAIALDTVNAIRFYLHGVNCQTAIDCSTYIGGYNTIHRLYITTAVSGTVQYKVYRVDET